MKPNELQITYQRNMLISMTLVLMLSCVATGAWMIWGEGKVTNDRSVWSAHYNTPIAGEYLKGHPSGIKKGLQPGYLGNKICIVSETGGGTGPQLSSYTAPGPDLPLPIVTTRPIATIGHESFTPDTIIFVLNRPARVQTEAYLPPHYPINARYHKWECDITVRLHIDSTGTLLSAEFISDEGPHIEFFRKAVQRVLFKQGYDPKIANGVCVTTFHEVTYQFRLNKEKVSCTPSTL